MAKRATNKAFAKILPTLSPELLSLIENFDDLPDSLLVNSTVTAVILGTTPGTLEVWRSTGRYDLQFVKVGRMARYPVGGIRAFMQRRTRTSTS